MWNEAQHPRDEDGQFTASAQVAAANQKLDAIKGTRLVGRPKTDIRTEDVFKLPPLTAPDLVERNSSRVALPLHTTQLIPTQSVLSREGVRGAISREANKAAVGLPKIYEVGGKYFIKDGHHRLAAAKLLGLSSVAVEIYHG